MHADPCPRCIDLTRENARLLAELRAQSEVIAALASPHAEVLMRCALAADAAVPTGRTRCEEPRGGE